LVGANQSLSKDESVKKLHGEQVVGPHPWSGLENEGREAKDCMPEMLMQDSGEGSEKFCR